MIYPKTRQKLATLFQESSRSYRQKSDHQSADDVEWASWYAQQLQEQLQELLHARITLTDLTQLLLLADRLRQVRAPGARCSDFFTQFFIQCYLADNDQDVSLSCCTRR